MPLVRYIETLNAKLGLLRFECLWSTPPMEKLGFSVAPLLQKLRHDVSNPSGTKAKATPKGKPKRKAITKATAKAKQKQSKAKAKPKAQPVPSRDSFKTVITMSAVASER